MYALSAKLIVRNDLLSWLIVMIDCEEMIYAQLVKMVSGSRGTEERENFEGWSFQMWEMLTIVKQNRSTEINGWEASLWEIWWNLETEFCSLVSKVLQPS